MAYVVAPAQPIAFSVAQQALWDVGFHAGTINRVTDIGPQSGTDASPIAPSIPDDTEGKYSFGSSQEFKGVTHEDIFTGSGRGSKWNNIDAMYVDRILVSPGSVVSINGSIAMHGHPGGDGEADRGCGGLLGIFFVDKFGATIASKFVTRRYATVVGDPAGSATIPRKQWGDLAVSMAAPANAFAFGVQGSTLGHNGTTTAYLKIDEVNFTSPTADVQVSPLGTILANQEFTVKLKDSTFQAGIIQSVEYIATNTDTLVETSLGTSAVGPDFSVSASLPTSGTYEVVGMMDVGDGVIVETTEAPLVIGAPPPPLTREYKASNSYTYLLSEDFVGLSSFIPPTARVTGVEFLVDFEAGVLSRNRDLGASAELSNPDIVFDIVRAGTFELALFSNDGTTYTRLGSTEQVDFTFQRSDFTVLEEGTSEGMKWTVMGSVPLSATIGGDTSLFGVDPIEADEFVDLGLGLRFYPRLNAKPSYADVGDACIRMLIDKIRLRVYFDSGSATYYFASPDKFDVIEGTASSYNVNSGDLKTGDAAGTLQLIPELVIKDGVETSIQTDWTVHASYPPTDSNQIAVVAENMSYNGLPTQYSISLTRSRYEFMSTNFYGDRELNSIYGVNGADRAFSYNTNFFYKIQTQPDLVKDRPRHLAKHHQHLALGYDDGRVDISVVGEPYNFNGVDGASSWAFADPVTGLLELSGMILGVFCHKSINGIAGTTVDNFGTQVFSPNIGAIEYTIVDMGYPVYANAYGIYTLNQTVEYGQYVGTPLSQDVSPWLRPRLQTKEDSSKGIVAAWPVRSKNQYRLNFKDGYTLTMTMNNGAASSPTFSKQQYTVTEDSASIRAVSSQLDDGGVERLHVSLAPIYD